MASTLPDRNRSILQNTIIIAVVLALIAIIYYLIVNSAKPVNRSVIFRVESSGGFANITLQAGTTSIPKATTVTTPWQKIITLSHGTEVYLTAANPTQSGVISCSMSLDGQSWKKEKATDPVDGVACAGIVP
ncbi:MAG: hypothetical protein WCK35_28910 [Chloroflexota bacterium]